MSDNNLHSLAAVAAAGGLELRVITTYMGGKAELENRRRAWRRATRTLLDCAHGNELYDPVSMRRELTRVFNESLAQANAAIAKVKRQRIRVELDDANMTLKQLRLQMEETNKLIREKSLEYARANNE